MACLKSHLGVLKLAKSKGFESVCICEDDVYFAPDFVGKLNACLKSLPTDWDALWLGGTTAGTGYRVPVNSLVSKTAGTWGAFAYIVRAKAFDKFIEVVEQQADRLDGYYSTLQNELNCFIANEKLALHRKGFSDIQGMELDYVHLR